MDLNWRKSERSNSNGSACVEVVAVSARDAEELR